MQQLNAESHFHNDLGLDSLDTVEVVMAIEEVRRNAGSMRKAKLTAAQEFSIEIPDKEADAIHSGMCLGGWLADWAILMISQSSRQSSTFLPSPMVSRKHGCTWHGPMLTWGIAH